MTTAIRKHMRDFLAIIALVVIAALVGGYVLAHQRIYLPAWVPIVGKDDYILKAQFQTAQALTPGQGQTVDIAGVQVGEISNVDLVNGRALVTMRIKKKYDSIYPNATMLMRPKTGLKDMIIEMDPGSPSPSGRQPLKSGATLPVANTQPDVNLDEILASLDTDTRDYLQLLLNGAGTGLDGEGRTLAQLFRRFDPTGRDIEQITKLLAQRRKSISRVMHNLQVVLHAFGDRDQQLREFVSSSNAVFKRFANQTANLERTLAALPSALHQTRTAVEKTRTFAEALGSGLEAIRPTARNLGPALRATRPFLEQSTPIVRDEIGPFTHAVQPTVQDLRVAASDLANAAPATTSAFKDVNQLLNMLAYNPPGKQEGYLFYLAWLNHLSNSVVSSQDSVSALTRALTLVPCKTYSALNSVRQIDDPTSKTRALAMLLQLINLPSPTVDNPGLCAKNVLATLARATPPASTTNATNTNP